MPRELLYTVETRQHGEPWRVMWRGAGEQIAIDAGKGLTSERWERLSVSIPRYPWVRVRQGRHVVWTSTPADRRAA